MSDEPTRNGNGAASQIARLSERSVAHQEKLNTHASQIAALEALVIEREKNRGFRQWLPGAAIFAAGAFGIFQFGISPLEDKITAGETNSLTRHIDQQKRLNYIRDDAEKQRSVIWNLTQAEFEKRERWILELRDTAHKAQGANNTQHDERIKRLERFSDERVQSAK